jgi:hypothetical protein
VNDEQLASLLTAMGGQEFEALVAACCEGVTTPPQPAHVERAAMVAWLVGVSREHRNVRAYLEEFLT